MAERFDAVILGAGPGGETVGRRLGRAGLRVALVERELVGGECAYWACVPSKTLLRAPEVRHEARRLEGVAEPALDWAAIARYRDSMIHGLDDAAKAAEMQDAGVKVLRGAGRIVAPGRVAVGDATLETTRIVIATGTDDDVPPVDGIDRVALWTSRELYTMPAPPRDAIVLGGGPVGVESAQMLRRHGTDVTIVEPADRLLPREDAEVGELIGRRLGADGVALRVGVEPVRVAEAAGRLVLWLADGERLEAERLVCVAGRRPRVAEVGLETLGILPGPQGQIVVDDRLRAGPDVWAVGDVTGILPFTHVAHYQGDVAADDILGTPRRADYRAIPRVVYTDPEVAALGLTREEARGAGADIVEGTVALERLARIDTYGVGLEGFMTVRADRAAGVLVGATAVGPLASEWIGSAVLAVKARVPVAVLRDTPMQFPTFGEALSYAVRDLDL
jgi:dihydrolipoamide dehydrogenase